MDFNKAHVGKHRQDISQEEAEAQDAAGLTAGVTPDLHAPEIVSPADETETNLHGDIDGSPYSANPGEMTLADAAEQDKAAPEQAMSDADGTREREIESRVTGVDTETLAAEDEAEGNAPKAAPKRSTGKK